MFEEMEIVRGLGRKPKKTVPPMLITFALIATLASSSIHAKIIKCIDSMGKVSYTGTICKTDNGKEKAIVVKENSVIKTVNEAGEIGLVPGVPRGPHIPNPKGIRTGFIGYGINSDHPQLKGLVIGEKDFTGEGLQASQGRGTREALMYVGADLKLTIWRGLYRSKIDQAIHVSCLDFKQEKNESAYHVNVRKSKTAVSS